MLHPIDEHGAERFPEILDYLPISEDYSLSERTIKFKVIPERKPVTPYENYNEIKKKVPEWWSNHNKLKHKFSKEIFKKADLKTVRDSLAGAFLLNVVHKPAVYRLNKYGLLKPKYQAQKIKQYQIGDYLKKSKPPVY